MNRKNENGFTLIEILIAVVIMGVGMLITAKMQLVAVQNTQGGYMRAQAANIGYDVIDRMRSNIPAVTAGNYDIAAGAAKPGPIDCKGNDSDCSTAQMAQFDQFWWRETIEEFLPNGTGGIVTADNGTFTKITVTLSWVDPYSAAQGAEQNVFTAELPR